MRQFVFSCLALLLAAPASAVDLGHVHFNQTEIVEKSTAIDLGDPIAVFGAVFDQMADEVTVYPTENYFYFSFFANGTKYSGNLRLHPDDREAGIVHFAYFDTADANQIQHVALSTEHGVTLTRRSPLIYQMGYKDRTVSMVLNPISQEPPSAPTVHSDEAFVGRGADESGLVFSLVYNPTANVFLWVLDPDQPLPLVLTPVAAGLDVHILSGFTFYRDGADGRQILLGVDHYNIVRNTWFDGPFDQLPDNTIDGTHFQAFAERAIPGLAGQINARGEFLDAEARVAIMPYMSYRSLADVVSRVQDCQAPGYQVPRATTLACLFRN